MFRADPARRSLYRAPGLCMILSKDMRYACLESPMGWLTVVSGPSGLRMVAFGRPRSPAAGGPGVIEDLIEDEIEDEIVNGPALEQLSEYFQGRRQSFDLPLDLVGSPFQVAVWRALAQIPFGETRSYAGIARAIGRPDAARAVGMANHRNPIAIVIPCHRVIGSDGSLTGYAAGVDLKARLLAFEASVRTTSVSMKGTDAAGHHSRGRSTPLPAAVLS